MKSKIGNVWVKISKSCELQRVAFNPLFGLAVFTFIFIFFQLTVAFAHHGNSEKIYVCKLIASAKMNGVYSGGDGSPEGGQFFGEFIEEFKHGDLITLKIHGNSTVGGFIEVKDSSEGKFWGTILTGDSYVDLPYAPFKKDEIGSEFQTVALLIRYKMTYLITFTRSVLRVTRLGNSPTSELTTIRHSFADCKSAGTN